MRNEEEVGLERPREAGMQHRGRGRQHLSLGDTHKRALEERGINKWGGEGRSKA